MIELLELQEVKIWLPPKYSFQSYSKGSPDCSPDYPVLKYTYPRDPEEMPWNSKTYYLICATNGQIMRSRLVSKIEIASA